MRTGERRLVSSLPLWMTSTTTYGEHSTRRWTRPSEARSHCMDPSQSSQRLATAPLSTRSSPTCGGPSTVVYGRRPPVKASGSLSLSVRIMLLWDRLTTVRRSIYLYVLPMWCFDDLYVMHACNALVEQMAAPDVSMSTSITAV